MQRGALLLGLAALAVSSCHATPATTTPVEPSSGFSHVLPQHAAVGCADCHAGAKMPPHAACARCHADRFTAEVIAKRDVEQPACAVCHETQTVRVLASRFSHKVHLDRGRMESLAGFHDQCEDCHAPGADEGGHRAEATHEACARCHGEKLAPQMSNCTGCHGGAGAMALGRRLIHGDVKFSHAVHTVDRVGRTYSCRYCHEDVDDWRNVRDRKSPEMQRCTLCHEDRRVTPPDVRIGNCQGCHQSAGGSLWAGVLAPRSHQLGTVAPDDHDLAFRRNHAVAARDAGARCAACHQGLSGGRRDSCAECHATMRPRDHTITWREQDHGREAAAMRGRCAQCHAADYCESCHSITPRSHVPIVIWRQEHGIAARFNLRSCYACHTYESSCIQCHPRGLR